MPQRPSTLQIVNPLLTNIATMYRPTKFNLIADIAMPRIPVQKRDGTFVQFTKDDRFTVPNTYRGPRAQANSVYFGQSSSTYSVKDYALSDLVLDTEQENASDPLRPQMDATEGIADLMLLDREVRVASLLTSTANITQNVTLAGVNQWSDFVNSNPMTDMETAKGTCFFKPNTVILGKEVYQKVIHHPDLLDRVKYSERGVLTAELLAMLWEVDNVYVADCRKNTAAEGQTAAYSYVWGKDVLVAYITQQPKVRDVSLGYTFQWTPMGGTGGMRTRVWREEEYGGGGEMIEVDTALDEKIVSADVAYLIKAAVA